MEELLKSIENLEKYCKRLEKCDYYQGHHERKQTLGLIELIKKLYKEYTKDSKINEIDKDLLIISIKSSRQMSKACKRHLNHALCRDSIKGCEEYIDKSLHVISCML